jgi:hypothetical protein
MTPTFQFFEDICGELYSSDEAVLPEDTFLSSQNERGDRNEDLLRDLQDEYKELDPLAAVPRALTALRDHFRARGSELPFAYDLPTRSFSVVDKPYIEFVFKASGMRGVPQDSRAFEIATANRLSKRGIGSFHRTGWPRSTNKTAKEFNQYLQGMGFDNRVHVGNQKDAGFDILWMLPLGAVPRRPILSFQCKNGSYDITAAGASNVTTQMSFSCHEGLSNTVHTLCVIFNDYIDERILSKKPFPFVPLGLSDLAALSDPLTSLDVL